MAAEVKYLNSSNVRVFPTAFRKNVETSSGTGTTTTITYNPESKLNTEFNLTTMASRLADKSTFVLDYSADNDVMTVSMHGYWFELSKINEKRTADSGLWAAVRIYDPNADSADNTKFSLPTLVSLEDTTASLDDMNLDSGTNDNFLGIGFYDSEPTPSGDYGTLYTLQLFDENGDVPESSKLKMSSASVSNGNASDEPISKKFTTSALTSMTATVSGTDGFNYSGVTDSSADTKYVHNFWGNAVNGTKGIPQRIDHKCFTYNTKEHKLQISAAFSLADRTDITPTHILMCDYDAKREVLINADTTTSTYYPYFLQFKDGGNNTEFIVDGSMNLSMKSDGTPYFESDAQNSKVRASKISVTETDGFNYSGISFIDTTHSSNTNHVLWMSEVSGNKISGTPKTDGYLYWNNKNATLTVNGTCKAGTFNASSDARLKENIKEYACDKSILDLPVKKFDFIDGPKSQIGCIAQDLQVICPEIVHEGEDGYLSIQESKIVYLLLQEVKKLRAEVDELKGAQK